MQFTDSAIQKGKNSKRGFAAAGATLALLLSASVASAQGPTCNTATLNGAYVTSGSGVSGAFATAMSGKVTYDGHGGAQATFTQSVGGISTKYTSVPGTYTINSDCTGSQTFGTTSFDFVASAEGGEVSWIVTSAYVMTGRATRLDTYGDLHITKNCAQYTGAAGSSCMITSSTLAAIKTGAQVVYLTDQTANFAAGILDTPAFIDAGSGNMAFGRCTLDSLNYGVCTFSGGTGTLAGFKASLAVSGFSTSPTELNYHWDGKYSFSQDPLK